LLGRSGRGGGGQGRRAFCAVLLDFCIMTHDGISEEESTLHTGVCAFSSAVQKSRLIYDAKIRETPASRRLVIKAIIN
jgi:hypothetical protein